MKTLIVYDSVYGNTGKLAAAMGEALEARTVKAANVTKEDLEGVKLLIAASPTRAFQPMPTIKKWIKSLPSDSLSGVKVAAFDTRVSLEEVDSKVLTFMAGRFGYAAEPMAKGLAKKGGTPAAEPEGFIVSGNEGPLKEGEMDRAIVWAQSCV